MLIRLFANIVCLIAKTYRIKINGTLPQNAVVCFWHGEMLPVWKVFSNGNNVSVVSQSKDGEILSAILHRWNYQLIRGSSSKGGSQVIADLENINLNNNNILITPDGPKGPKNQCKAGAFVVSQRKQIPLYFVSCNIRCKKIFHKSWDKFQFPLLFSKLEINVSEPLNIPHNASKEDIGQIISYCNNTFKQ